MSSTLMNRPLPLLVLTLTLAASRGAGATDDARVARCEVTDKLRPFTRSGATRIAITDFDVTGRGAAPEDGARIADMLCRALDTMVEVELKNEQIFIPSADLEIVRVPRPVRTFPEGRTLGQDLGADVVVWGDGSCEIPKGELILKASDEASRAVAGSVRARGYEKVTVEAVEGGTAVGGDLDVEALNVYSVCTRAALVSWDLYADGKSTDSLSMRELRDLPLGSFTVGEPQAVLDLVLMTHFAYRHDPLQADHFLSSVRDSLATRPDLVVLAFLVAHVDHDLGRMDDARRQLHQILETTRATGNKRLEAVALNGIGLVYSNLGDNRRALEFYEQALPILRTVRDRWGKASTLNNIGHAYAALGDQQRALEFYEQALPIRRAVGDRPGEAITLSNIGAAYAALGDKKRALKFYEQALPLQHAVGDRSGEGATLDNIGRIYDDFGDQKRALEYFEQALQLQRAVGDRYGEAHTLNNVGWVYDALGDKRRALEYYEQALLIRRAVEDRSGEANTLNNIGAVYAALGNQKLALEFYEQALPIIRAIGDRSGEGATLNNIGAVYTALGDQERALAFFEQALPITRAVGDPLGLHATLSNMGLIKVELGNVEAGVADLEEAIRGSCAVQHPDCMTDIGAWYKLAREHGQVDSAERALQLFIQLSGNPAPPAIVAALRRIAQPQDLGGQGVLITEVLPSSNALRSRLQTEDIVVRYDGEPVDGTAAFVARVTSTSDRTEPVPIVLIRVDKVIYQTVEPGPLGARIEAVP